MHFYSTKHQVRLIVYIFPVNYMQLKYELVTVFAKTTVSAASFDVN